jgi:hypothetical protein
MGDSFLPYRDNKQSWSFGESESEATGACARVIKKIATPLSGENNDTL